MTTIGIPTIGAEVGSKITAKPTVTNWTNSLGVTGNGLMSSIKLTDDISKLPKKNSGHILTKSRLAANMIMTKAKPPPLGVGFL
jgi:PDZ domain-containing secreted protein